MQPVCTFAESLAGVDSLVDTKISLGVEAKIRNLVAALRMFGVRTIQSCEGHEGVRDPYVQIVLEDAVLAIALLTHFNRHDRQDRGKHYYWVLSPMPFGCTLEPHAVYPHRPLADLQAETEEFAQTLIRLADKLCSEPLPRR